MSLVLILAAAASVAAAGAPPFRPGADVMTAPVSAGYYTFQRVVYQNDGGGSDDRAYFGQLLRNLAAHEAATHGRVEIRVVSFARGVKLFEMAKTDAALAAGIDGLKAKGVRFLVCRNTLQAMNRRPEDLYGVAPADVVPSGAAEIARLQGLGFVYVHP